MSLRTPYERGKEGCRLDAIENAPFASVGGLERRKDMIAPSYILGDIGKVEYLRGYREEALAMFGPQWQECEFSWQLSLEV